MGRDAAKSPALLADEEDEDVAAALDPLLTVATTTASATRAFNRIVHRQNPEEHEPLSSAFDGPSPTSAIVAVDTDLGTSSLALTEHHLHLCLMMFSH
ncbi:unnamed protein product [Miscanthus lutarioriparius]|uniref:Uncharacterized protein n=1 Tax=Miscanthus lutarioriparius TaxID=422564 RepID=A0A811NED2_9POAL|nr:unnamed protein product [Miscanthus lutarioriparius]